MGVGWGGRWIINIQEYTRHRKEIVTGGGQGGEPDLVQITSFLGKEGLGHA